MDDPGAFASRAKPSVLHRQRSGSMQAAEHLFNFTAPGLLIVPSTVVHGFQWHGESSGSVITLANSYPAELIRRDKDVETLCRNPHPYR
jgi:AraC family transcriptional regulator, transcriptional activator of pobA